MFLTAAAPGSATTARSHVLSAYTPAERSDGQTACLLELLSELGRLGYEFVTPTPATHARVLARSSLGRAADLADVFGWSMPFEPQMLGESLLHILRSGGLIEPAGDGLFRSLVRVSALDGDLYVHSAYPTEAEDAVFFGPDSYRFARFIQVELASARPANIRSIVDVGTGTGVGAIVAGKMFPGARVVGTDVNTRALSVAEANATAAGIALETCLAADLRPITASIDLVLANPPYIMDARSRTYRDGGGILGTAVALAMIRAALDWLSPNGTFLLYSGSAIVRGHDHLRAELGALAAEAGFEMTYGEIDPDVFGEELAEAAYRKVERIAAIAAVFRRGATTAGAR